MHHITMRRLSKWQCHRELDCVASILTEDSAMAEPVHWADDLTPIAAADWSFDCAAASSGASGGTPEDVVRLAYRSRGLHDQRRWPVDARQEGSAAGFAVFSNRCATDRHRHIAE